MKTGKIFWGVGFILVAVAIVLDALGVMAPFASAVGEISLLAVLAAALLVAFIVSRIAEGKIGGIFVPLSLIFMLFEKNIATVIGLSDTNIINNWLLLFCACLLWIGFSILFPGYKRKLKMIKKNGEKTAWSKSELTSSVRYIDASSFGTEWTENNLGSLVVRFENADKYTGGGTLYVENNLGSTVVEVPSSWRLITNMDNSLGSVVTPSDMGDPNAPLLTIKGDNNLGSVVVKFV